MFAATDRGRCCSCGGGGERDTGVETLVVGGGASLIFLKVSRCLTKAWLNKVIKVRGGTRWQIKRVGTLLEYKQLAVNVGTRAAIY